MKNSLTLLLLAMLLNALGSISPAHAQGFPSLFSPQVVQSYIKPGYSTRVEYTIENRGDPTIVKAYLLPFEPQDAYGNVRLKRNVEGPIQFSLENTGIDLNDSFILKSGQSSKLNLRVAVPENIREGDYYYTFVIETEPPPAEQGVSTARVRTTLGSHLLLTVTSQGAIAPTLQAGLFGISPRFKFSLWGKPIQLVDSFDIIPVTLLVKNTAQNLTSVSGNITLQPAIGKPRAFALTPAYILKQSQRLMTTQSSTPSSPPRSLFVSGMFLGNYTLSAQLNSQGSQPITVASTSFTALPFKAGGIVVLVLLLVFIFKKAIVRIKIND